jgi:hypothetical protein
MNEAFQVHMLNDVGKEKAREIAQAFDQLLNEVEALCSPSGREIAIVRTKLEEACFFAKKAMASRPQNQK